MSENYYESLTPQENEDSKGIQNTYNTNQSNITQNEMTFEYVDVDDIMFKCIIPLAIFLTFILIITVVLICIEKNVFLRIIFSMPFLIGIIIYFLYLFLKPKKLIIIKNESYNLLIVKIINCLNCSKSTLNFNLQNVIMDKIYNKALVITNTFKNSTDIDLNLSNIKNKPIKNIYHIFTDIDIYKYTAVSLRNFLGISPEIENPVNFNINKYMGKSSGKLPIFRYPFTNLILSKCMKMSDYFFSYYLEEPSCYCNRLNGFICIIITIPITLLFMSLFIFGIFHSLKYGHHETFKINVIILIIILTISSIIIIINIIFINIYSLRIDIIYSQNFDTIFIALLNHNGTSYKKTFIHDMNSIERFIIESYNNSNAKSILKVVYKDKNIEDILRIDESKDNLDGLLFILNKNFTNYQQV